MDQSARRLEGWGTDGKLHSRKLGFKSEISVTVMFIRP